ncbi:hypothetical protein PUV47_01260 [Pseudovibrio exalbescens]|uniref:hypothetical protein n=1 Tax=Pseudovibrio exalbescens TaxID=197461 RepID=UPI00236654BB|nr:hypothetical protein [Pseudovibrio exalbescens]MDD7908529.1 hypothetical protein [Pseudovibrio exalbescens]
MMTIGFVVRQYSLAPGFVYLVDAPSLGQPVQMPKTSANAGEAKVFERREAASFWAEELTKDQPAYVPAWQVSKVSMLPGADDRMTLHEAHGGA